MEPETCTPFPLNFYELSAEQLSPSFSSLYLWDTCRHGKLFLPESYDLISFRKWMDGLLETTISSVILPQRFDSGRVTKLFKRKVSEALSESKITELFSSLDAENVRSIEQLIRQSAEKSREGFENIIRVLRQDEFPPMLWMELGRYVKFSSRAMDFLGARMVRLLDLSPRSRREAMRRSKQAWSMSKYYGELPIHLTDSFLAVLRIFLFLEFWSCEKEEELFGSIPWTFKNVDLTAFESMMFQLHSSIDGLANSLLHLQRRTLEAPSDFSEPIGWAFKQLVQIA
jgi:hypothetical protein